MVQRCPTCRQRVHHRWTPQDELVPRCVLTELAHIARQGLQLMRTQLSAIRDAVERARVATKGVSPSVAECATGGPALSSHLVAALEAALTEQRRHCEMRRESCSRSSRVAADAPGNVADRLRAALGQHPAVEDSSQTPPPRISWRARERGLPALSPPPPPMSREHASSQVHRTRDVGLQVDVGGAALRATLRSLVHEMEVALVADTRHDRADVDARDERQLAQRLPAISVAVFRRIQELEGRLQLLEGLSGGSGHARRSRRSGEGWVPRPLVVSRLMSPTHDTRVASHQRQRQWRAGKSEDTAALHGKQLFSCDAIESIGAPFHS